jgi:(2S)-[(R)-hydroxy(phenyl)methyl]-succinyl-CoA dehydrogenase BbsD subunit
VDKRIAIITGAAKGIGKAIAHELVGQNFFVIIVDIDKSSGLATEQEIGKENTKFFYCEISKEENVINLFKSVIKAYKKIDVLVNNAGILRDSLIWKMSSEHYDSVLEVNLKSYWLTCKEAAIVMKDQQYGRIINITSRAWLGNRGQTNYSASKAGVVGLTRSLALELGRYNVFVNAVAPGLIDTPLTQALPKKVMDSLLEAQPTKTAGKPEDVANVVAFLSAEKTKFITGQVLYVDGGKSIGAY